MKKFIPLLAGVFLTLGLISCNQPNKMDDATMQKRIDSSYAADRQTIVDEENKVCTDNLEARVREKADSIIKAAN